MSNNNSNEITLFDGHDYLFKKNLQNCRIYFEYGVGKSTSYVIKNTKAKIIAVDTDKSWIESIDISKRRKDIKLNWVNLGELENWGRPKTYSYRNNFIDYIGAVWHFNLKADVILIDGRFRVACFIYSLLNAEEGSVIIFDDYINRSFYHVVEEIVPRFDECGRQAVFKVPKQFNINLAKKLLDKFIYVFD